MSCENLCDFELRNLSYFKSGFRTRKRNTFLCVAKEKYSKERPPDYHALRVPCASRFALGSAEGASLPLCRGCASMRIPCGLFQYKAAMLGVVDGMDAAQHYTVLTGDISIL